MEISQVLRPVVVFSSLEEPLDNTTEDIGDDIGGGSSENADGADLEGVDDGPFGLQGDDFDEELAARIMLQDGFDGGEGHVDWVQGVEDA